MPEPNVSSTLKEIELRGWCFTAPMSDGEITSLITKLGPVVTSARTNDNYVDLKPYEKQGAPRHSMSAHTGTGEQPMHTDAAFWPAPPRYVVLQCLATGEAPCPTRLWSVDLPRLARDYGTLIEKPNWIASGGGNMPFYCPILDRRGTTTRLRFDPLCMHAVGRGSQTIGEMMEMLEGHARRSAVEWTRGRVLLIDNWRCLHARASGADMAPSRRLRRWYIGEKNELVN